MAINHMMCGQESTVRQHGLISRRQAREAGMTPRMIEWRLRQGIWVAEHPGVYRSAGAPVTWHARLMAAAMAGGEMALVSHRAAAALWRLDGHETEQAEVTVAGTARRRIRGVLVHHTRPWCPADRGLVAGIPCTSAGRTLIDLAGVDDGEKLEAALDAALREGLVAPGYLSRRLAAASQGRPGAARLRRLVEARTGERPPESPREATIERLLVAAGLPKPVRQYELRRGGRVLARFDLAWPERRVAVEFQSYRHHFGRQAWRRDVGRFNEAAGAGWLVFGVTEDDVTDGCRSVSPRITAALCCASP